MYRLSIILISWNSLGYLRKCVEALMPILPQLDARLIWVDNGSCDGAWEWMEANAPQAQRVRLERNKGVAFARNRGLELAQSDYILFLDDDTVPNAQSIMAMMHHLDKNPRCGICAVALRDANGCLQESFKPFPGLGRKLKNLFFYKCSGKENVKLPDSIIHPCYVIGACQMFRSEITAKIGMLDQSIFYGPEDADFCIRARKAGWQTEFLPSYSITHHWRRATNRHPFSPLARKHASALLRFYIKHKRIF